jgi:PAS domain S-box-containing protein
MRANLKLICILTLLTVAVTWVVIFGWEFWLRPPFYAWVRSRFPAELHWPIEQRSEHFFISVAVDVVVVTLLLRLITRQQRGLLATEDRYRAVFEHASDGIAVLRASDHSILQANRSLQDLLGYSPGELTGKWVDELVAGATPLISHLETAPAGEKSIVMRTAQGADRPVSVVCSRLSSGEEELIALVVRDLSERKRAEEQVTKLSRAVQQTADMVCISDRNGVIEYINPAFERLTGYSSSEAVGQNCRILKSGKHPQALYERMWATIVAGGVFRGIIINRKKNGELYYEEKTITPLTDAFGKITHFVSTGKDITERKEAEEALRDSEARYRRLFEANPLPMWVYDVESLAFLAVNEAAVRRYGYSREEFLSMSIKDIRPEEDVPLLLADIKRDRHGLNMAGVWRHRSKDGSLMMVEITSHPLLFEGRRAECVLSNDVSERLRLEAEKEEMSRQLFQSSKLASIGELSAGVAHEIGNPVNSIINFAQLLQDYGVARNARESEVIDGIISEGNRIGRIVHDLLTFARRDSQESTQIAISEIVKTSISLFSRQLELDGIALQVDIADDLPPVLGSGSLLGQVFLNLVTNARHALKNKPVGHRMLRISGRGDEKAGERIVRLEFYDNGVGIPPEHLEKIFDPFFTTRRDSGGTGLGLSLSFSIIRRFGGTIMVESELGSHTVFRIDLPAMKALEASDV